MLYMVMTFTDFTVGTFLIVKPLLKFWSPDLLATSLLSGTSLSQKD